MNAWKAYHNKVAQVARPRDRDAEELAQVTAALLRADSEGVAKRRGRAGQAALDPVRRQRMP